MRKIVLAGMSTVSGLAMLFSYHTSTNATPAAAATTTTGSSGSASSGSASSSGGTGTSSSGTASSGTASSGAPSTSPSAKASAAKGASGTYTGDAVNTRWGVVQVQITVQNGKITKADAVQFPQGNGRDAQINAYAVPILNQEVVTAQSASIDSVSGATVTSGGYLQSLQSAIDQAHL